MEPGRLGRYSDRVGAERPRNWGSILVMGKRLFSIASRPTLESTQWLPVGKAAGA
jgi:hypothetical protein